VEGELAGFRTDAHFTGNGVSDLYAWLIPVQLDSSVPSVYAFAIQSSRNVVMARNLLIGAGAYYLSGWLDMPLAFVFGKLTQGLTYMGDFNGYVVMPLVVHLPWAIVAAAVGATVVWLVESDRPLSPLRWAPLPGPFIRASWFSRIPLGAASTDLGPTSADDRRTISRALMRYRCTGGSRTTSNSARN